MVDPLHELIVAVGIRVEDPGQHAVGRLDHEGVRARVDLEHAVEVLALRHAPEHAGRVCEGSEPVCTEQGGTNGAQES